MADEIPILVPQESVLDQVVRVVALHVPEGATVSAGQMLCEIETSKAVLEIVAPGNGVVAWNCAAGEVVAVGAGLGVIRPAGARAAAPSAPTTATAAAPAEGGPIFSAEALRLIAEHGLDRRRFAHLPFVRGAEVKAALAPPPAAPPPAPPAAATLPASAPARLPALATTAKPLPINKKAEGAILGAGQNALLSSCTIALELPSGPAAAGATVAQFAGTTAPVILATASRLLHDFPDLNAYYLDGVIHQYEAVVIGYAVGFDADLKVAAIGDLSGLSAGEITRKIMAVALEYRRGGLGGLFALPSTFTVTDLSGEGVALFTPLVNGFQSAILGLGAPDRTLGRQYLTLSFDHRVTTGRRAAQFLRRLKDECEARLAPQP